MSIKQYPEDLSAMMDDELETPRALQLLEALSEDPELRKKQQRLALIRSCLRREPGWVPGPDFSRSVQVALADEPTVLAPKSHRRVFSERFGTLALAASMAALAVLVVRSVNEYSPERAGALLASVHLSTPVVRASLGPDLEDYLKMHHESAYLTGMQGLMPSVRLVSDAPGR